MVMLPACTDPGPTSELVAQAPVLTTCLVFCVHLNPAGAARCAPAFYSAKGSLKPCQACPAGRSTLDDPTMQARITDCLVRPGHGVINSTAAGVDAFSLDVSVMTAEQQAELLVMECPVGYFGAGGDVGSTCTKCPCGSSTQATGATTEADCNGKSHLNLLAGLNVACAHFVLHRGLPSNAAACMGATVK
jgi:hypothetical protein